MLTYLVLIALILFVAHLYFNYKKDVRLIRKLPCPEDIFFFGNALDFVLSSPVGLFKLARKYASIGNGIYGWFGFGVTSVNIYNPEDIEIITATMKHSDKSIVYEILYPWLREGLLISNGAKWHQRRKILTPAFHFKTLKRYYIGLEENGKRLVETLINSRGDAIDIVPVISEYTLSSICDTAMGTSLYEMKSGNQYKNALYVLGELFVLRFLKIYLTPNFIFKRTSIGKRTYSNLKTVHSFTKNVIKERKEFIEKNATQLQENDDDNGVYITNKRKKTAMLDLLISAEKEGVIDDVGIQEEVDTFMFEGHDTTAAGLTYCLMLLANHKEVQEKIVAELKDIYGDSQREPELEDQTQMKYMECCIKESLRLYPPVPFISRTLTEDTQLSGNKIPAGMTCHIHIYDLHRQEKLYKNASSFDPDRFLPENSIGRHPYSFLPFSAGPRNCIGQRFAYMEMKSCLAAILRRFELHPVTAVEDIEITCDLVLRPIKPIYVKFVEKDEPF